jgi:hypothetical protein
MITETKQLITCFISTKNEILRDHGASRAWGPRASLCTAPTVTTHHYVNDIARYGDWLSAPSFSDLSGAELADDHLAAHAARAGRAADGAGGRVAAWYASAPFARVANAVGHAESVAVAPVEQVKQAARVVTEQQPRDVSHPRHLLVI